MTDFTHLHVHTQYSILDGASDINVLMNKVRQYGMKAISITDHGNMFGVLDFLKASKEIKEKFDYSIKPIIGCEMYVADGSRFEKKGKEDRSGFHLILLAKNYEGYRNLSKLCSFAYKKEAPPQSAPPPPRSPSGTDDPERVRPPTGREPVPEARCHCAQNLYHFVPGYATLHSDRGNERPPLGTGQFDIGSFIATLPLRNEYRIQGE